MAILEWFQDMENDQSELHRTILAKPDAFQDLFVSFQTKINDLNRNVLKEVPNMMMISEYLVFHHYQKWLSVISGLYLSTSLGKDIAEWLHDDFHYNTFLEKKANGLVGKQMIVMFVRVMDALYHSALIHGLAFYSMERRVNVRDSAAQRKRNLTTSQFLNQYNQFLIPLAGKIVHEMEANSEVFYHSTIGFTFVLDSNVLQCMKYYQSCLR
jgi:hypothetical protein